MARGVAPGPAQSRQDPAAFLRSLQVIHVALCLGVVVFACVVAALAPLGQPSESLTKALEVLVLVAAAWSVASAALALVLPGRLVGAAPQSDLPRRLAAFRTGRIVAAALCEGPALLWCVIVLLGGNLAYLGAAGALLLVLALGFPTAGQLREATGLSARDV